MMIVKLFLDMTASFSKKELSHARIVDVAFKAIRRAGKKILEGVSCRC